MYPLRWLNLLWRAHLPTLAESACLKDGTVKKDSRQDFFYNVADVQSALVGEGKLYTQEEWDNAETMAASADVKASYLNGKFENSAELRAQDAATANAAWELTSTIVKGLKKLQSRCPGNGLLQR